MNPTPRSVWENAEPGQAFLTTWKEFDLDEYPPVVWVKGPADSPYWVNDLNWEDLVSLTPITIHYEQEVHA